MFKSVDFFFHISQAELISIQIIRVYLRTIAYDVRYLLAIFDIYYIPAYLPYIPQLFSAPIPKLKSDVLKFLYSEKAKSPP